MLTLIMWHNRFSENENEAVEAHIPRHRDSKTKKPQHRDSKTKNARDWDSKTKKPRHRETETSKPRHRDSKTKKPRHRDSKAKKPQHRIHVKFWPLCPLIDCIGIWVRLGGELRWVESWCFGRVTVTVTSQIQ